MQPVRLSDIKAKHSRHYLQCLISLACRYSKDYKTSLEAISSLDTDLPQIDEALSNLGKTIEEAPELSHLATQALLTAMDLLNLRLSFEQRLKLANIGLKQARNDNEKHAEIHFLNHAGNFNRCLQNAKGAAQLHEQALKLAGSVKENALIGLSYGYAGYAYSKIGETAKAKRYLRHAIEHAKEVKDQKWEGYWLGTLGSILTNEDERDESRAVILREWKLARHRKDIRGYAVSIGRLAGYCTRNNRDEQAIRLYGRAIEVANEVDDPFNLPIWFRGIAQAYWSIGEESQALVFFDKEIDHQKTRGNSSGQRIAYERIGDLLSASGQLEKALSSYRNAYLISCNQSDLQIQESHLSDLAVNLYNLDRFNEAKIHFRRCLKLARVLEDNSLVINRLDDIGDCQLALGKNVSANRSYLAALSTSREVLQTVMHLGSTENVLDQCENNSRIVHKLNESTRSAEIAKFGQLFDHCSSSSFRIEAMARLSAPKE